MNFSQFKKEWQDVMLIMPSKFDVDQTLNDYYTEYKTSAYGKGMTVMEWCNDYFSEFNLDNHPYMLKKKINPPQVRWVAIDEQKPGYDGTLFVFGLINEGSPHECFSTFFAVYDKESDKFFDFHGDTICEKVTHWMYVE